jgi:predicted regulator of amino acid metabolism with ACT domain
MKDETFTIVNNKEMMDMVDAPVSDEIIRQILLTKTPVHAMATLAVCVARVIVSIVDNEESANQNIESITKFAKVISQSLMPIRNKSSEDSHTQH